MVDSKCFEAEARNVNPNDTLTYVDRDLSREVHYCHPSARTKLFALVQPDWQTFQFDSAGNLKVAELVRTSGKKYIAVTVTGEASGKLIKVESIAMTK